MWQTVNILQQKAIQKSAKLPDMSTLAQCNAVFQASTGKKLQGKNYEKITGPGNMVPNIQLVIEWH